MDDSTHGDIPSKAAGKGAWLKDNPTLAKLLLLGGLVVLAGVGVAVYMMMDGDKKKGRSTAASRTAPARAPAPPPAVPPAQGNQPNQEQTPGEDTPKQDAPEEPGDPNQPDRPQDRDGPEAADNPQAADQPGTETDPAQPQQPARPEDVAQWKGPDFRSARKEGDPRLIDAIESVAKRAPDSAKLPAALASLLAPPQAEEQGTQPNRPPVYRTSTRGQGGDLTMTIVEALEANRTDAAGKVLEQILAGSIPTEDDQATVEATLDTLADNPNPRNDALLFRVLTEAEKLRPEGREGQVTAAGLREKALALVQEVASEQFRTKLAGYLLGDTSPREHRTTLGGFLEESHPDNLGAQLLLYRSDQTPDETKQKLEGYFTDYGSQAMARILGVSAEAVSTTPRRTYSGPGRRSGVSSPARGPASPQPAADESQQSDAPYRMARRLWTGEGLQIVTGGLGKLESLEEQGQLVAWAGTIPVEPVRRALIKALQKHWPDGPKSLEAAGATGKVVSDPGFLLVIKTLVRKQGTVRFPSTQGHEQVRQTKTDWSEFSDALVRAWCERLRSAGSARTEADRVAGRTAGEGDSAAALPIVLPPDAKPVAGYHLSWPNGQTAKLAGVTPGKVEIHFVRIEQKARLKTTIGYYMRQVGARTGDVRHVDKTDWIEGLRVFRDNDRKRSIDVLITSLEEKENTDTTARTASKSQPEEPEDMVIEILSIEIKDPEKS